MRRGGYQLWWTDAIRETPGNGEFGTMPQVQIDKLQNILLVKMDC
jgi:hypothetical protein